MLRCVVRRSSFVVRRSSFVVRRSSRWLVFAGVVFCRDSLVPLLPLPYPCRHCCGSVPSLLLFAVVAVGEFATVFVVGAAAFIFRQLIFTLRVETSLIFTWWATRGWLTAVIVAAKRCRPSMR